MINITVIAVGKLKEDYLKKGCGEYLKRLRSYAKVSVMEITEEKINHNPSESDIENVKSKEGERILSAVPKGAAVFTLCIEGDQLSSTDFSEKIRSVSMNNSKLCFIIGGSFGLGEEVKRMSMQRISFGKITLPHQLARIVLLEQIYRAFSILNNSKYHK